MNLTTITQELFHNPQKKLAVLFFLAIFLFVIVHTFGFMTKLTPIIGIIIGIILLIFAGYFFVLIFRIIFELTIKKPIDKMLNATNIASLILSYAAVVFGILLLSSIGFMEIANLDLGYITYGQCSDTFDKTAITTDSVASMDYFYFSAVTFFTVGYGDICPMGASKLMSLVVAFVGNVFSVIIMAVVISSYVGRRQK